MIAVVPSDVARHYANYGMLAILPVELPISMAKLGIITRRKKELSPAVRAFMQTLQASLREGRSSR